MQNIDVIILPQSIVHKKNLTALTLKNKKEQPMHILELFSYVRSPRSIDITVSCSFVLRLFHILKTSFYFSVRFSELPSWKNCDNVTPKAIHIFSSVISDGRFSCAMILPSDDWEIPDSCDNLYLLISRFSHKDVILSAIYFSICK